MGQMIRKPDANPIIIAVCNCFVFGALGYFLLGQQKKAIIAAVISFVTSFVTCGTLFWVPICIFAYDGYLLADKLSKGEAIGENENGLPFLNAVFKD